MKILPIVFLFFVLPAFAGFNEDVDVYQLDRAIVQDCTWSKVEDENQCIYGYEDICQEVETGPIFRAPVYDEETCTTIDEFAYVGDGELITWTDTRDFSINSLRWDALVCATDPVVNDFDFNQRCYYFTDEAVTEYYTADGRIYTVRGENGLYDMHWIRRWPADVRDPSAIFSVTIKRNTPPRTVNLTLIYKVR